MTTCGSTYVTNRPSLLERWRAYLLARRTSPAARRRLARRWDELAVRARRPSTPFDPRVPIARAQIDAAADGIALVAEVLRSDRPLSPRGIALAGELLTSPDSPVYRIGRGSSDVAGAVRRALAAM